MCTKYYIKLLFTPQLCRGWHFHRAPDGIITLTQRLLINQTVHNASLLGANGKTTMHPSKTAYHGPRQGDVTVMKTISTYRLHIGELRYIVDSTRLEIGYVVSRLVVSFAQPTKWHFNILKVTLLYLKITWNYGLYFRATKQSSGICNRSKTSPICANADGDWANDVVGG